MNTTVPLPPAGTLARTFERARCVIVPDFVSSDVIGSWRSKAKELAGRFARSIHRDQDGHLLHYQVVGGSDIRNHWPELYAFYADPEVRRWVAAVAGEERVFLSTHLQSAVNLNIMDEPGQAYRWHFDAVPYTLLLFLSSHEPEDGGIFEYVPADGGHPVGIVPRAGTAVLMDGSVCRHRATPLLRPGLRLSVPMVYPRTADHQRPHDLDGYLYGES